MGFEAAAGLFGAALAVNTVAAIGQGQAAKAAADARARQASIEAARAEQIGRIEADRARREGSRAAGRQRALVASRGLRTGSGTGRLLDDELRSGALVNDSLARNQASARAFDLRQQSAIARFQGTVARDLAFLSAGSSLLRAGGNVAMTTRDKFSIENVAKGLSRSSF